MPEEVLLEEFVGPPKRKVEVRIIVGNGGLVIERMMELLDRQIQEERIPLGVDIVLRITKEEDRRGGVAFVEGGGVFGHFPAERRVLLADQSTMLSLAVAQSLQAFTFPESRIEPFLLVREGKKNWPVERYGQLAGKGVRSLNMATKGKPQKNKRRG